MRFSELYSDVKNYDDIFQPALDYVNQNHDPTNFLSKMFELAELMSKGQNFRNYLF
jgi:hypothetical protein